PRSALISGLSLCLILRTGSPGLATAAAVIAIASKFLIRFNGKHLFNPTNFGLVAMMALTPRVWVSPGQWGYSALFAFLMPYLGGVAVFRAWRGAVTAAFLAASAPLLFARRPLPGDPVSIPLHQLQ